MDTSSIIVEVWKIRRIEGLSCKENLVALFLMELIYIHVWKLSPRGLFVVIFGE